jgi:hypothetical protein
MVYATITDIESRLGRTLSADEMLRAPGLLQEASALVDGYCDMLIPDPEPAAVVVVTSKIAARGLTTAQDRAEGVSSEQLVSGPFSRNLSFAGEGSSMWIGAAEKLMLRPWRSGMRSVALISDREAL